MMENISLAQGRRGIAMVEAMTALTLLMVGLTGVMAITNWSISINRVISDQYIASYLASEGIEIVKNLIDANVIQGNAWDQGILNGQYALDYETTLRGDGGCSPRPQKLCSYQPQYLFFDVRTGTYSSIRGASAQPPTHKFMRVVEIDKVSADEIRVISRVSWEGRGGSAFDIELQDHFFNWRP